MQKNIKGSNDLFVKPIDVIDNNIPNGNSIFLLVCNKIFNITEDNFWKEKIETLKNLIIPQLIIAILKCSVT